VLDIISLPTGRNFLDTEIHYAVNIKRFIRDIVFGLRAPRLGVAEPLYGTDVKQFFVLIEPLLSEKIALNLELILKFFIKIVDVSRQFIVKKKPKLWVLRGFYDALHAGTELLFLFAQGFLSEPDLKPTSVYH
jgi:hypothetical protein